MGNREGPYRRLQRVMVAWVWKVARPRRRIMFVFDGKRLSEGWDLRGIAERAAAADTLGWDTHLRYKDGKLEFVYVERPGDPPDEVFP